MSLRGRYLIDRIKSAISHRFKLPCPPYGNEAYWDGVYKTLGPSDVYEWGNLSFENDLLKFQYDSTRFVKEVQQYGCCSLPDEMATTNVETTFAEVINVHPNEPHKKLLLLGCGNSRMGEEMVHHGWLGPIIQLDISRKAVYSLQERWSMLHQQRQQLQQHQQAESSVVTHQPVMEFLQDDAGELSAISSNTIHAVFDKGLIDAMFCSDQYDKIYDIMNAVHRVLIPNGGVFSFLSFSEPQFLLKRTLISPSASHARDNDTKNKHRGARNDPLHTWKDVQICALPNILMYRYEKQDPLVLREQHMKKQYQKQLKFRTRTGQYRRTRR